MYHQHQSKIQHGKYFIRILPYLLIVVSEILSKSTRRVERKLEFEFDIE